MVKRARVQAAAGEAEALEEEADEASRRPGCLERIVRLVAFECFGVAIRRVSADQRLASRYFLPFMTEADPVKLLFRQHRVSMRNRRRWMEMWSEVDSKGSNQAEFADFARFMKLKQQDRTPNSWWQRIFDMMNTDFSGQATFQQFVVFAWRYCVMEKPKVVEFAFRLLSRRGGGVFKGEQNVISLDDLLFFASYRYPTFPTKIREKRCIQLLELMDEDDSGGLSFSEFDRFVTSFTSFLSFAFKFLWRLRVRIMGDIYWNEVVHAQRAKLDVDVEWTRELFSAAQKFWRRGQPSFDDDFRDLAITLRRRKIARMKEQMEERQRLQKELLSRLKPSTYTRVWNACLDLSKARGKLRPAFDTWKEVSQATRPPDNEEETDEASVIAEPTVDVYAKILADTDAVARVDISVLANLCKTSQLAMLQGRTVGSDIHRSIVAGRHAVLKQESIRCAIAAVASGT